jgi:hypothetical protein
MHHCYFLGLPSGFFIIILHMFLVCLVGYLTMLSVSRLYSAVDRVISECGAADGLRIDGGS